MSKRVSWLSAVMLVAVLLGGCLRAPLRGGGGSKPVGVAGRVEFGDTGLSLQATLTIGSQVLATDNGRFNATLSPGIYNYTVITLLGTHKGTVSVSEGNDIILRIPEFVGFNEAEYNAFLLWGGQTRRWENDRVIKVWIENNAQQQQDKAWNALQSWQDVLRDTIVFKKTDDQDDADLEIHWSDLPDAEGKCDFVYYHPDTGYLEHARITIALSQKDNDRVYLHLTGHCIGLNHSINDAYLMSSTGNATKIHTEEANYARLLYSLPAGVSEL